MGNPMPKIRVAAFALCLLGGATPAMAWDQFFWEMYTKRADGVTVGVGNARDVNAVTHMRDPWPPDVGNRHIPGNGQRMADTVVRYRDVTKIRPCSPQPIAPVFEAQLGIRGADQGTALGAAAAGAVAGCSTLPPGTNMGLSVGR